jgi:1-acyl-sn-glycerol-3-phosphate acyltransferase
LILGAMGFRVEGDFPNTGKFVIIAVPHTSNWDFPLAMGAKLALSLEAVWLGKHSIFVFPFGLVLRALGGFPVDRSAKSDVVQQVTAEFAKRDRMILGLAPEGTRKRVERWRTGFYHIAHAAGVPIVGAALDWKARVVRILPPFKTTGAVDADITHLRKQFEGLDGRRSAP